MATQTEKDSQISHFIELATSCEVPPLYIAAEYDGIITKEYPFISRHPLVVQREGSFPIKKFKKSDITLLSLYKNEIENQLSLNRDYCVRNYNKIKNNVTFYLRKKFKETNGVFSGNNDFGSVASFALQVHYVLTYTLYGTEVGYIKEELNKKDRFKAKINYVNDSNKETTFDINDIYEENTDLLGGIERVVLRSVSLYFIYISLQVQIYDLNPNELQSSSIKVLSPFEKVQLIEKARKQPGIRNYDEAILTASKKFEEPLYKDYDSFKVVRHRFKDFLQ